MTAVHLRWPLPSGWGVSVKPCAGPPRMAQLANPPLGTQALAPPVCAHSPFLSPTSDPKQPRGGHAAQVLGWRTPAPRGLPGQPGWVKATSRRPGRGACGEEALSLRRREGDLGGQGGQGLGRPPPTHPPGEAESCSRSGLRHNSCPGQWGLWGLWGAGLQTGVGWGAAATFLTPWPVTVSPSQVVRGPGAPYLSSQ